MQFKNIKSTKYRESSRYRSNTLYKLLKIAAEIVAPLLTKISDKIIFTSIFPNDWKLARVTSVFKKGKKDVMDKY